MKTLKALGLLIFDIASIGIIGYGLISLMIEFRVLHYIAMF